MRLVASVLIPVRNEEADIEGCLRCLANQDLGAGAIEVIIADGRSTDRTVAVIGGLAAELGFGRLECVDNPRTGISAGLNVALALATASVIVRIDARSRIEPHYVRTVVEVLKARDEVGVVGGAQIPIDRGSGSLTAGIARALLNRLTTGFSRYRRRGTSGPSDTVWMGAFRTRELRALGGWDEELSINEDYELCERYRAQGRLVWFRDDLRSGYLPRADLEQLARQYFAYGLAKGARWAEGTPVAPRHLVLVASPPLAVLAGGALARRIGVPPTAFIAAAAAFAVDHLGGPSAPASMAHRAVAVVATGTYVGAWWSGALVGWLRGRGRRGRQTAGAGRRPVS